ncbi:MAG TPA: acyltransferase domain-containing protein [Streptosporangiaceae bacterium]|nr:acyltransferase domain-containing protein [Streptosporangiaceae bacterium]
MTTAVIFPGQGSQRAGMGAGLFDRYPELAEQASEVMGWPVREVCLRDPEGQLSNTVYTQPARHVVNVLALRAARDDGLAPDILLGHSVGEYAALYGADVFDFETGLRLVRARAGLMAEVGGGMSAVLGLSADVIATVLDGAGLTGLDLANLNAYDQIVLSGPTGMLAEATPHLLAAGAARVVPLPVSGPFHSRYLREAARKFAEVVKGYRLAAPKLPVIANLTAREYPADGIGRVLAEQIDHQVRWAESLTYLLSSHPGIEFIELGGTPTLASTVRRARQQVTDTRPPTTARRQRTMQAVYATGPSPSDPLAAVAVGERPEPTLPDGWTTVRVHAATLNGHDLATLRGIGVAPATYPLILGCDGAGVDPDGNPVIIHPVLDDPGWDGEETMNPCRALLSERHDGTFAEKIAVPRRNLIPMPRWLSFAEGAALGASWLTAYRMLFSRSGLQPGDTVLVQGSGGGLAQALIALGRLGGFRVWATGRRPESRALALRLGAHAVFEAGAALPGPVDAVMDSVGHATWQHSLEALRPGGTLVLAGATTGANPPARLMRTFFLQLSIVGVVAGSRQEFRKLLNLLECSDVRPHIDQEYPLADTPAALRRMASGDVNGKLVVLPQA